MTRLKVLDTKIQKLEKGVERQYHVSWFIIAFKFITGLIELLFGVAIAILGAPAFLVYRQFLQDELIGEAHGTIAKISEWALPYIFANHATLSFYLCVLGIAKVAGSIGLIYGKDWGADLLIILTLVLFPFQVIEFVSSPSLFELGYILVGIFVALYLVNFKPRNWGERLVFKIKNKFKKTF